MTKDISELPAGSTVIRPATEDDLAGMEALAERMLPPTYVQTGLLDATEVQRIIDGFWSSEYLSSLLRDGGILWVAELAGSVVGVAEVGRLSEADAILWKLYVDNHLQAQGLGTQLLAAVGSQLWPGTQRFFTEYVTGNEAAAAFYARRGFEFDHEEHDSRPDVDATYTWCVRKAADPIHLP